MAISERTLEATDLRGRSAMDLLREVLDQRVPVRIVFENGSSVDILPESGVAPMITLAGHVPDGWKDAVYGH